MGGWIADEAADGFAETEREAYYDPEDADNAGGDHAFDHGGDNVFSVHHTAIEEGKSGRHQEYEGCGNHDPGDIGRIILGRICKGGRTRYE